MYLFELENEFYSLEGTDTYTYCTINYGFEYDGENLYSLITDENGGTIYFINLNNNLIDEESIKDVDSNYYFYPDREIINRIFTFNWEYGFE